MLIFDTAASFVKLFTEKCPLQYMHQPQVNVACKLWFNKHNVIFRSCVKSTNHHCITYQLNIITAYALI